MWKDETSYSRNETNRIPRTWVNQSDWLKIVVTRHVDFEPDIWTLVANVGNLAQRVILDAREIESAKAEAMFRVRAEFNHGLRLLDRIS
jgi:hypothetical protein